MSVSILKLENSYRICWVMAVTGILATSIISSSKSGICTSWNNYYRIDRRWISSSYTEKWREIEKENEIEKNEMNWEKWNEFEKIAIHHWDEIWELKYMRNRCA